MFLIVKYVLNNRYDELNIDEVDNIDNRTWKLKPNPLIHLILYTLLLIIPRLNIITNILRALRIKERTNRVSGDLLHIILSQRELLSPVHK